MADAALVHRKTFQQHRLGDGHHRAAADALKNARQNQRWQIPRQSAQHRGEREDGHTGKQHAFPAEIISQPAGHRQDDGVGNQIARQHPGGLVGGRRKAAGDVRQRDVGDGRVEHLHEHRHHHRHRDEPGIMARMPVLVMCAVGHGRMLLGCWLSRVWKLCYCLMDSLDFFELLSAVQLPASRPEPHRRRPARITPPGQSPNPAG